jgi:hypothetical protein
MKWTWDQYLAQPEWFVRMLTWLLIEEAKESNRRNS